MAGSGSGVGGGLTAPVMRGGQAVTPRPNPYAGQLVSGAGSGKGGGGAVGQPMPRPTQGQFAPLTPRGGFNVNQASAAALQQALRGTQRAIGDTGMYTSMVTGQTLADLERQRQMQQNQIAAQASRAGAFGGSRHGVAEALTNEAFARQGAQTFGNLQLGQQQARMQGAAQMGQLGQQAFNIGQAIQQQQAQQGLLQQGLQQALIDAARGQYQGYVGSPQQALQAPLAALGVVPTDSQTTTKSKQPGFFDYAALAATAASRICWVAREVYGEGNPKWLQFRDWVVGASPDWFFNLYSKHGEKVAEKVKRNPWTKKVLRPLMDIARKSLGYK